MYVFGYAQRRHGEHERLPYSSSERVFLQNRFRRLLLLVKIIDNLKIKLSILYPPRICQGGLHMFCKSRRRKENAFSVNRLHIQTAFAQFALRRTVRSLCRIYQIFLHILLKKYCENALLENFKTK